jgi:hypothetical protein
MKPQSRLWLTHVTRASAVVRFLTASRHLITYRDRDVALVWTLEHLFKTNWQRSSSVQIKPSQPSELAVNPLQSSPDRVSGVNHGFSGDYRTEPD